MTETVKNQGFIIKDLNKQLKSRYSINEINNLLNQKANINDVSQAIDDLYNSIEERPTISFISELNNEKISKSEINYYLNKKASYEDLENIIKEKMEREINSKFEELFQNFEILKKDIDSKIRNYTTNEDFKNFQTKLEKRENDDIVEIKNALDKKADKENVYNSLKLKSDKNEINTLLCNKLDKSDLANIIKSLGEKLNKEEFLKYKEINENKKIYKNNIDRNIYDINNSNNINIVNDVKAINNDVQEMKKNINKRIDIINTDIERFLDNINSKFETMNIAINNNNKKILETEANNNISNLLKKKLDIEKFDSFVKKIKYNLENNYLEISKNSNEKIETLIDSHINNINQSISEFFSKQNNIMNDYINKNKNEMAQYQIRVQGIMNSIEEENKLEIIKIKNEFMEKLEEKLITDKLYNLTEETKNRNSINQISLEKKILNNNISFLNTNEKDTNNYKQLTEPETNKNDKNTNRNKDSEILEKNDIKDIYMKFGEIQNEINKNKNEFYNAMDTQSIINETLCNENKLGRWIWNAGKLKNNYNIIWDTQKINTSPDNFKLENDKSTLIIVEEGYYEIIFGFYGNSKKPNIQILINNEVVISNANKNINSNSANQICSNTIYSGFMKTSRNGFGNNNFRNSTGLTIIDFIFLQNNAKLNVFYNGEIGKGFIGLKKL